MKANKSRHHRQTIRLKEFEYSTPWWYYVTICTHNHQNLFGMIQNGKMFLNDVGKTVECEWLKTKEIRKNVDLDHYVIMPNHIHGIIIMECRGELNSPQCEKKGRMQYAPTEKKFKSPSQTLGSIIRGFKSSVTKQINEMQNVLSLKIWQRNYYEHIVRNDNDLHRIRTYIQDNPLKWELDEYYLSHEVK